MTRKTSALLISLFLLSALTFGIYIFLINFDFNNYKSYISKKAGDMLKKEVIIGNIKVVFLDGIKFQFSDVIIGESEDKNKNIHLENIAVSLNLIKLISGEVTLKEIVLLNPFISFNIDKKGKITLLNTFVLNSASQYEKPKQVVLPDIKKIRIIDAKIKIVDNYTEKKTKTTDISDFNFTIKKSLLRKAYNFSLFFSAKDSKDPISTDLDIKGMANNFIKNGKFILDDINLNLKLAIKSLNLSRYQKYINLSKRIKKFAHIVDLDIRYNGDILGKKFTSSGDITLHVKGKQKKKNKLLNNKVNSANISFSTEMRNRSYVFDKLNIKAGNILLKSKLSVKEISINNKLVQYDLLDINFDLKDLYEVFNLSLMPKKIQDNIKKHIKKGRIKSGSLKFAGTLDQFMDFKLSNNTLYGELEFSNLLIYINNTLSPVTDLNGKILLEEQGIIKFLTTSLIYGKSTFKNISGTVSNIYKNPHLNAKIIGNFKLSDLKKTLPNILKNKKALKNIHSFQGNSDINLLLNGYLKKPETLKLNGLISFKNAGVKFYKDYYLKEVNGDMNFDQENIMFSNLNGKFADFPFTIHGDIKSFNKKNSKVSINLKSEIKSLELSNFLKLKNLTIDPEKHADLDIDITGSLNKIFFITKVNLKNLSYSYDDFFKKRAGINNELILTGNFEKDKGLKINEAKISLNEKDIIDVKTNFSSKKEKAEFKIHIEKIDLVKTNSIPFLLFSPDSKGSIYGDITLNTDKKNKEKTNLKGLIAFFISNFKVRDKKLKIKTFNGKLLFDKKSFQLKRIVAHIGNSRAFVDIESKDTSTKEFFVNVDASKLHLIELETLKPKKPSDRKINLKVKSKTALYKGQKLKELSGKFTVKRSKTNIHELNFKMLDGRIQVFGILEKTAINPEKREFKLNIKARNINFDKFLKDFSPKLVGCLDGKFSFNSNLKGIGTESTDIKKNLSGTFNFSIEKGILNKAKFKNLKKDKNHKKDNRKKDDEKDIKFDEISSDFKILGGIANTDNFALKVVGISVLTAAGKIDLGKNKMDANSCYKKHVITDAVLNKIPIFGRLIQGKDKSVSLQCFTIKGDMKNLKIEDINPKFFGAKVFDNLLYPLKLEKK